MTVNKENKSRGVRKMCEREFSFTRASNLRKYLSNMWRDKDAFFNKETIWLNILQNVKISKARFLSNVSPILFLRVIGAKQ